jgi:hypothetical protein
MSTITDAMGKKKHEEEAKASKTIDLAGPPKVDVPRERRGFRRGIYLSLTIMVIAAIAVSGYLFRIQIRDYVASVMAHSSKGRASTSEDENLSEPADVSAAGNSARVTTEGEAASEAEGFPELTVDGIYHDPLDPEVLINGKWRKTGETVDGVRIEEILKDGVRVKYKGSERTILFR